MGTFYRGLSLAWGTFFRGLSLAWGTFYQELSLGYFLPRDYPYKELSFGYFPLGLILLGNYPWGSFYQGLSMGALSFSPPIKGVWGPLEGLHYGGRWIRIACSDAPQQHSLSTHSHAMGICALFTQSVGVAW